MRFRLAPDIRTVAVRDGEIRDQWAEGIHFERPAMRCGGAGNEDRHSPRRQRHYAFLVDTKLPDSSAARTWRKLGLKAQDTSELLLRELESAGGQHAGP